MITLKEKYPNTRKSQQELEANGITLEAKEAFSRKPYYGMTGNFVKKPRINK